MAGLLLGGNSFAVGLGKFAPLVVLFLAFALFFIVAIGNRTDQDPTGSRPMAAYLFSAAFLFLWVTYAGIDLAANAIIQAVGSHSQSYFAPNYTNTVIRSCVLAAILLIFGGGAFWMHLSRGNALSDAEPDPSGPTKRIMRSYVALVSFLSIIIVVLSLISAIWLICGLISPTIFQATSNRTDEVRAIAQSLVLVVLAGVIFRFHQRFAPDNLRLFSMGGGAHHTPSQPAPTAPPAA